MTDEKILFGAIATIISCIGYVPYLRDILRQKTKPHAFSWLIWGVLTGTAFLLQVTTAAGPGSWVTGLSASVCFIIFLLALKKGDRSFPIIDWITLSFAACTFILWRLTNNPTVSVILVTLIDVIGFLPSFRKGYYKPFEETTSAFSLGSIKWIFGILALDHLSLTTWLYPASLILTNGAFVIMLLMRRKQLRRHM